MSQQDCTSIFLLIIIAVLFIKEQQRQRQERHNQTISDPQKAEAILHSLDLQADVITSMNGRIDTLGQVVEAVVRILELEHRQQQQEKGGTRQ